VSSASPLYTRELCSLSACSDETSHDMPSGVKVTTQTVYTLVYAINIYIIVLTRAIFANARLRYFTCDLYVHLDGECVVVVLALQLIQDDREHGRRA
jgi:hypothetical protein